MSDRPLQLMLVDEDPVFRLGLKVWLEQQGDFTVVAETESAQQTLEAVRSRFQAYQQAFNEPTLRHAAPPAVPIDLVILDLGIGARDPEATPGLQLCQQIKTEFPGLPVLVLSAQAEPVLQAAAERMGAAGYGTRSMSVRRLAQLIRQAAIGTPAEELAQVPPSEAVRESAVSGIDRWGVGDRSAASLTSLDNIPGPLTAMRISMRLSGLQQIDQNLAEINLARQRTTTWINQAILDGKKRELMAARWLISAIWRTPKFGDQPPSGRRSGQAYSANRQLDQRSASTDWIRIAQQGGYSTGQSYGDMTAARYLDREALIPRTAAALAATEARLQERPGDVQNVVFEGVFAKLQRPLKNISQSPLEIDILRADKKLELLYLVLRQLEELLADLRASQVQPGQLPARSAQVIHDLWDAVNTEFFGKYYTVRVGYVEEEVVTLLQREKAIVQAQILDRIPRVSELFGHWLFQESMVIESAPYLATTPQAIAYSERLLENLIIQVANAVIQPLLNRLADVESIKKSLYTSRLMSSRDIERFRNDLSWRYRWDRLVNEPKAIFESRYDLYVLTPNGIDKTAIYAPRRAELDQLGGIPLMVTLAMETRDALSPRLRAAIALVGSSVVYVLTEVLGRGIGLVGRGILQGVGNAWQDTKGKRRQQPVYPEPPPQATKSYAETSYPPDYSEWE
jgi:DNA-binding NarL/FixJ family response regulator